MAERKLPLNVAFEGNTPHLVMHAVEAGLGYTTLPFCSAYRFYRDGRVAVAPVDQLQVSWAFVQSREQPLSTAGEALKNVLRETVESRIASGEWPGAKLVA